jgi:hypothetical protein
VVIWYIFPLLGILYQGKSSNPDTHTAEKIHIQSISLVLFVTRWRGGGMRKINKKYLDEHSKTSLICFASLCFRRFCIFSEIQFGGVGSRFPRKCSFRPQPSNTAKSRWALIVGSRQTFEMPLRKKTKAGLVINQDGENKNQEGP